MIRRFTALLALGPMNLARVGLYRILLRLRQHPVQRLSQDAPVAPFFTVPEHRAPTGVEPRKSWREDALYFGWSSRPLRGPPDWLANSFRPDVRVPADRPWWTIPDFDPHVGDIKTVWEASRFDWLIAMSERAVSGELGEVDRLNSWLEDWLKVNPAYLGPNWKCGQEASIRVMHLALAAILLGQVSSPTAGLTDMVRLHLRRIAPTIGYAIGQQNNHGTSEAAALFIGGAWLASIGDREGLRYSRIGRYWLENRARTLIADDGTFSQYSVTYHRVMLDTYSLAEAWRRILSAPRFSADLYHRLTGAVLWLRDLTDSGSGDAPNLGANDGARIVALTDADYRDFRPSVQLAAALLSDARAWPEPGNWDDPLVWLGLPSPGSSLPPAQSRTLDDGGFHILRSDRVTAVLRFPRFRFRPSQADALHLDVWLNGVNLIRDAGSFSYNTSEEEVAYFTGAQGHSLVEVDGRDQMPRISRFLFGSWLRARDVRAVSPTRDGVAASASYKDAWGAQVHRTVNLSRDSLTCVDVVEGHAGKAVVRWRLAPGDWVLDGSSARNGAVCIEIEATSPLVRTSLLEGVEARFYLRKTPAPVLEVETTAPCTLTTRVTF